jgi:hypothetical protein
LVDLISFEDKARAGWGDALPDWVLALAKKCDATSQAAVARQIDRSSALVSTVIARRYGIDGHGGDLGAVETLVRRTLMNEQVDCPFFGESISTDACHRHRNPRTESTAAAMIFGVCRRCQNNPDREDA